ncbi:DNA excision repair protein ERCC-6-like [Larimichthys crocea]|uniref:DNA excision repair protein ERCC-6-like n=1 Tax=Larimichthys crocea TaxID=215358 RepID=A0A6G0IM04_LARCR|nr:DNA excision repair protein ERCC-6-like [Larimichthys crocea]
MDRTGLIWICVESLRDPVRAASAETLHEERTVMSQLHRALSLKTSTPMSLTYAGSYPTMPSSSDPAVLSNSLCRLCAKTFKAEYENPITRAREKDATPGEKALGSRMSENLMAIIKPYFLRRTKSEVQKNKMNGMKATVHSSHQNILGNRGFKVLRLDGTRRKQLKTNEECPALTGLWFWF